MMRLPRLIPAPPVVLAILLTFTAIAGAEDYYVDGANPVASDSNPGTEALPYRTIAAAALAHTAGGNTIFVKPARYSEPITVRKWIYGPGQFVFRAAGPGVEVSGVAISGRDNVVVDGFTILGPVDIGGSRNVVLRHNSIPASGIYATDCFGMQIISNIVAGGYDGISLRGGFGSLIEDNDVCHNVNKGIVLNGYGNNSRAIRIIRNRIYDNGASAIAQYQSFENVSIQNLIWGNQHGILHSRTERCIHVGDVVWGNANDGVWIKDYSIDLTLSNCIIAENGTGNSSAYAMYVDSITPYPQSDDNIFWYSSGQPLMRVGDRVYRTLTDWRTATGRDTRSIQANPRFRDPANHDFHLTQRSPAIDCANSGVAGWLDTDAEGLPAFDDPHIPNSGIGPVAYADRGAFEFVPNSLDVDPAASTPAGLLLSIHPNPMRTAARVEYALTSPAYVRVTVIDVQGRAVATIVDDRLAAGRHIAQWNGGAAAGAVRPGLYFLRLETASGTCTRRFVIAR